MVLAELGYAQTSAQIAQILQIAQLRNLNCTLPDFFFACAICVCGFHIFFLLAQFAFVVFIYFFLVAQFAFALLRSFFSIAQFAFAHRLFKILLRFTCSLNFLRSAQPQSQVGYLSKNK